MSEILENLFGSRERMRILRFFLQNPEQEYSAEEIIKRNMIKSSRAKRELSSLTRIKFILRKTRKGKFFYVLNPTFIFYPELKNLVAKANIFPQSQSLKKIKDIGNVRLAAISGAFINYHKSKADMILVADDISRSRLKNIMRKLEAEIGKEIDFVLMNSEEFKYRLNMLDKFVLEFLEGPHEEVINKIIGLRQFIANRK